MWNKLEKRYKVLLSSFWFAMLAVANWNELTEFSLNISSKDVEVFIVKQKLGINLDLKTAFTTDKIL